MGKERQSDVSELLKGVGPISFDIDGVIVYSAYSALQQINRRLKTDHKLADVDEPYGMQKLLKADLSIKDPIKEDFDIWHSETVLAYAPVIPGAPMVCKLLSKLNHEHYFITSRPAFVKSFTKFWFDFGLPWVKHDQILMQDSGNEVNSDFKADKIKEKGIAFHFEDNLDHANKVMERTGASVVLVRHGWNKNYSNLDSKYANPRMVAPAGETPNLFLSFQALLNSLG